MFKLRSRRSKIIGAGFAVLVLVVGFMVAQQQRGAPSPALASADSTGVAEDQTDKPEKKGKDGKEEKVAPPVPVELITAAPRDIPAYFHSTGSLEAKRQIKLISKARGQIDRLTVEEGDMVKKGHVILELDHREEALMVEQAKVKAGTAERELVRIRGLVDKGLASDKDYEANKELSEVAALEHRLAQVRLDNKVVRAPFSGQITMRHIELGQTINVGEPLVDLADVSPLEVRLFLPEKIVSDLQPGQPVEIRSDVDADVPLMGTVDRISPAVDPSTSTVKVTLRVTDAQGKARVGSFVRARITTDTVTGAIAVPKSALVPEAGVIYLFVAEAESVLKVPVTTGYADDEFIEITGGLQLGDNVVSVGQGGLRHGSKIRDLNAPEPPADDIAADDTDTDTPSEAGDN